MFDELVLYHLIKDIIIDAHFQDFKATNCVLSRFLSIKIHFSELQRVDLCLELCINDKNLQFPKKVDPFLIVL